MLKPIDHLRLDVRHSGYAFQVQAVEAIKALPYGALFHEQGLGKTKIGIDLGLEWIRTGDVDSVLVVTKRSLVANWFDEIKAHTFLTARIVDQNRSSNFFALNSPNRLYLAHYEAVRSEEKRLKLFLKTRKVGVILDEAQKIKNPDAALTQCFHRLSDGFARRVIMTGTPVANRPFDIWAQIYFLDHGKSLGDSFDDFKSDLDLSNDLWEDEAKRARFEDALSNIYSRIKPFAVRETKGSAGIELPEKRVENIVVELEGRQRELYDQYKLQLGAEVLRGDELVEDEADEILKRLLRLVQVASNPLLVDESYVAEPGKVGRLIDLVKVAVEANSKIIVWTSFVDNAEWLAKRLSSFGSALVHGGRGIDERNAAITAFKTDSETRVLVATPGAAKEGLTLTVANHAVFYDRSFSLDDYLQAQDRIHRISQTQTCFVWNLLGADTIDEWVDSLLAAKRLAAQLAQADISVEQYRRVATYDFGRLVKEILSSEGEDE